MADLNLTIPDSEMTSEQRKCKKHDWQRTESVWVFCTKCHASTCDWEIKKHARQIYVLV